MYFLVFDLVMPLSPINFLGSPMRIIIVNNNQLLDTCSAYRRIVRNSLNKYPHKRERHWNTWTRMVNSRVSWTHEYEILIRVHNPVARSCTHYFGFSTETSGSDEPHRAAETENLFGHNKFLENVRNEISQYGKYYTTDVT